MNGKGGRGKVYKEHLGHPNSPSLPHSERHRKDHTLQVVSIQFFFGKSAQYRTCKARAGRMAQQVKVLTSKTTNLSPIPGTHTVERENQLLKVDL